MSDAGSQQSPAAVDPVGVTPRPELPVAWMADEAGSDKAILAAVTVAAESVVRRELGGCEITQVWSEPHCVLFRLADGRTGSIEVQVNWDAIVKTLGRCPK